MSYQVLARKYRPRTFDEVVGQDIIVKTLRNAINKGRLAHAYLFVGPRGTGKTSLARILAKALNCKGGPKADFDPEDEVCKEIAEGRSLDVIEIDGASNNGVEQIRNLRESVKFAPSSCQFRIYYIDEVHMLSISAFNALLKTLEEPPEHVKFIFATTESHKVPKTILSRCQRFDLRALPAPLIADTLAKIAKSEGFKAEPQALALLARLANGGMRDAQSMLDRVSAFADGEITLKDTQDSFGVSDLTSVAELIDAICAQDVALALSVCERQLSEGKDARLLNDEILEFLRGAFIFLADESYLRERFVDEEHEVIERVAKKLGAERLRRLANLFGDNADFIKNALNKDLAFESALVKACGIVGEVDISSLIKTVASGLALQGEGRSSKKVSIEKKKAERGKELIKKAIELFDAKLVTKV